MLKKLTVKGFKSLAGVTVDLPRLAVFFGPNAVGKSNLLDAVQTLSWMSVAPTLPDVLGGPFPIRGRAFESFSFGERGLPALLKRPSADFIENMDFYRAGKNDPSFKAFLGDLKANLRRSRA